MMAALAAPAVVLLGHRFVGILLDRPPDEPEQPGDRELEDEHQVDERPSHSVPRSYYPFGASASPGFDPRRAVVRTAC
jgi:hypothetical protein